MTAEENALDFLKAYHGNNTNDWLYQNKKVIAKLCVRFASQKDASKVAAYWEERCKLAEQLEKESPCDTDITRAQIEAHKQYNDFIKRFPTPPND